MGIYSNKLSSPQASEISNVRVRQGEKNKPWYRGERFLQINGQWYFTLREGRDVGPFNHRQSAERGLALFIEYRVKRRASIDHAITVAKNDNWAIVNYQ